MARPRVFISSTCFDLGDARAALTTFLEGYGFEVLNSQQGSFGVKPKVHSHEACLEEVESADLLVLLVGGRYGGTFIGSTRSITNEEVNKAQRLGIPIIAFVHRDVESNRRTYGKNPQGDFSHVVDSTRIFDFVHSLSSGQDDNWLHPFENVADVIDTLRHQLANHLRLYWRSLRKGEPAATSQRFRSAPFPPELRSLEGAEDGDEITQLRDDFKIVHDVLDHIISSPKSNSAKLEQLKTIWVIARHGGVDSWNSKITLKESKFKSMAWSRSKGQRVFELMEDSGIDGGYDVDNLGDVPTPTVALWFSKGADSTPAYALSLWVKALAEQYGEDEGLKLFQQNDMSVLPLIQKATATNAPREDA